MKKTMLSMMIITALMLFAGCSEKQDYQDYQDYQDHQDYTESAPEGLLDFGDFTVEAPGYEYSFNETAEGGEARFYEKDDSVMCVTWEDGELSKDDYSNVENIYIYDAEYSGVNGFEIIMTEQSHIFTFNINGRSWQIDCSNESDYYQIVETIRLK